MDDLMHPNILHSRSFSQSWRNCNSKDFLEIMSMCIPTVLCCTNFLQYMIQGPPSQYTQRFMSAFEYQTLHLFLRDILLLTICEPWYYPFRLHHKYWNCNWLCLLPVSHPAKIESWPNVCFFNLEENINTCLTMISSSQITILGWACVFTRPILWPTTNWS